ncbi:MAG: hypothetical protein KDA21_03180, partial [Phycisphaerales bacterium]|nr:hypothetical protein [Phycisphaerales bacterium]
PVVALNFLVSVGAVATDFTVTSASLGFPVYDPAFATASASTTVTDNNGDGASLTGNFPGGGAYRAFYNDPGSVPGTGTVFGTLVGDTSAGAWGSASTSDTTGPFSLVGVPVTSMSAQWKFGVDAFSSASGTSVFTIPAPGTAFALGVLGLPCVRRRRHA